MRKIYGCGGGDPARTNLAKRGRRGGGGDPEQTTQRSEREMGVERITQRRERERKKVSKKERKTERERWGWGRWILNGETSKDWIHKISESDAMNENSTKKNAHRVPFVKGVVYSRILITGVKTNTGLEFANYELPTVGVPSSALGLREHVCCLGTSPGGRLDWGHNKSKYRERKSVY